MKRPKDLPAWATDVSIDPETGVPTRLKPPQEKLAHGWRFKERPPFNWQNWWQYKVYEWVRYFAEQIPDKVTDLGVVSGKKMIVLDGAVIKLTLAGDTTLQLKATASVQQVKLVVQNTKHEIQWAKNVFTEDATSYAVNIFDVLTFDNGNTYFVRQWGAFGESNA